MHPAEDLSVRLVGPEDEQAVPTSELIVGGAPTGKVVPGAVLEAAIRWRSHYLLFMTDDTPHEDTLSVHLLDADLRLLDSATLGGPYTTGSFSSLELQEPNTVRFRFIGGVVWTVELLAEPQFRLPFVKDAPGVTRSPGFSRHFVIRGNPQPETSIKGRSS